MSDTTTIQLDLPLTTYQALQQVAETAHKTETELIVEAVQAYLQQEQARDSLLGLFANEPELVERVAEDALQSREQSTLRLMNTTHG